MSKHNLIAIDLAKNVFQICGLTSDQHVTFNKQLKRKDLTEFIANHKPVDIAMETCYSSHYWARLFQSMGHTVKLIPAQHVTPFVRGNKSDRNDALAIGEAARRPNITTVPIKSVEQQDLQSLHRMRERLISNRIALTNQTRGLLSEYGIVYPLGHKAFCILLQEVSQPACERLSPLLKTQINYIAGEFYALTDRINNIDVIISTVARQNTLCKILLSIPGVGPINATAIYSAIERGQQFKSAREFAVWLGLTPKQASSGNSFKSSGITKRGNCYLRKQLVHGARSVIFRCKNKDDKLSVWAKQIVARRGMQKACVAMAARMARIAWVLLQRQETYRVM